MHSFAVDSRGGDVGFVSLAFSGLRGASPRWIWCSFGGVLGFEVENVVWRCFAGVSDCEVDEELFLASGFVLWRGGVWGDLRWSSGRVLPMRVGVLVL